MSWISFLRILKFSVQNFFRNIWLSIVTVVIISLSLFSISFIIILSLLTQNTLKLVEEKTAVYIDLTKAAKSEQIQGIVSQLKSLPTVKDAKYISPSQALDSFKLRHSNDQLIQEALASLDSNPFNGSILLSVKKIDDFKVILTELSKPDYKQILEIDQQEFTNSKYLVDKISEYSNKIQKTAYAISLVFMLISILVVFNTIQVGIYTHREEIGIMKLVGASNTFIRAPFLIGAIFYSILGLVVLILGIIPLLIFIQPYTDSFLGEYSTNILGLIWQNGFKFFGWQLFISIVITCLSAALATRKYLKI